MSGAIIGKPIGQRMNMDELALKKHQKYERLMAADSNEGGHLFQSDRGHHSNLMAASLVSSRGPVLVMS
ncbi:MAG: hypothetical protein ABSC06_40050 [Rhodopila sp.]|jgi:hypothetical protein